MKLRDYQEQGIESIFREWETVDSTLTVMPTGTGKTVVFGHVINRWNAGRVLVLAHREELIFQAHDKISRITRTNPDIEMAGMRASRHGLLSESNVVVSSIQTQVAGRYCDLCDGGKSVSDNGNGEAARCPACIDGMIRRMQRFDPQEFGLVIVDEAHHVCAPTYRKVLDYYSRNPRVKVLGVTATPDRADEKALGQVFDSVAFEYGVLNAIEDGWLVPIMQEFVACEHLDFSRCRTTAGDLNGADLEAIMMAEEALHEVVSPTIEIAGNRPTLFFTVSVAHAEICAEILNRHRPNSAICIHGKTPTEDRRRLLREYAHGKYQYLCGCGVFLEGFDEPRIEVIAMARPTKSRSLYAQAVGRATRPITPPAGETPEERKAEIAASVKPSCVVLDFVGNSGRHKLVTTADILGGQFEEEIVDLAVRKAQESGGTIDMRKSLEQAEEEFREQERRRKAAIVARSRHSRVVVNPFDVFDLTPKREPGWHKGRMPTPRQKQALAKFKIEQREIDKLSFWQASQMLDALIGRAKEGRATYKQSKLLAKFGQPTDVSFDEARAIIDRIAQNDWQPIPVSS